MAAVEASVDEKARYNQAKKDLVAALAKKRQLDKQLVRDKALVQRTPC